MKGEKMEKWKSKERNCSMRKGTSRGGLMQNALLFEADWRMI